VELAKNATQRGVLSEFLKHAAKGASLKFAIAVEQEQSPPSRGASPKIIGSTKSQIALALD
jgi:hypothetical protein